MKNFFKSNFITIISVIFAILLIVLAIKYSSGFIQKDDLVTNQSNVTVEDGKQIIKIFAKGGYNPKHSIAKAGFHSILRIDTSGTYDCTSIIRIPKLNISRNLPMYGITDIDLGVQEIGILEGTCGMGMYPFDIKFE